MKDIKWLVHRLLSMNFLEILWRIRQKIIQKVEYKIIFSNHVPVTQTYNCKKITGLKADESRLGINWHNKNHELFEEIDLFDEYKYHEYKKYWNAGFQTENTWATSVFSYKISISQREDIGDIRTNWELNRHYQFVGLAKNYYLLHDEKYYDELVELFDDWNDNNLFLHGVQWTSTMEIAIRTISWVYMYAFVKRASCGEHDDFLERVLCGIKAMACYVDKHRARYSSANNHLIIEMLSLGVVGYLLDYEVWIKKAQRILTQQLSKQNFSDGVNKEMSLHYQCFIMEAYGIMCAIMKSNLKNISNIWMNHLKKMACFVADCCGKYGEVIVFGDNDEGKILDFIGKNRDYYGYVLNLVGLIVGVKYTDKTVDENLFWLFPSQKIFEYKKYSTYSPSQVSHYKEGGYTLLRSKDSKLLIGFDHAVLGFGKIAAHGHADALSIQVYYEGSPVMVDSGTYNYHISKKIRNESRMTSAHNTVYIEKHEQAQILGPFLWGKRYKVNEVMCHSNEGGIIVKGKIEYDGISHSRTIIFDMNKTLLIRDEIDSSCIKKQIWLIDEREQAYVQNNIVSGKHFSMQCGDVVDKKVIFISDKYNKKRVATKIEVPFFMNNLECRMVFGEFV